MLKKTVPLPVRLCTLFAFTFAGAIAADPVIEWIGIWPQRSFETIIVYVGYFATPQVIILSSIKAKLPLLTALGAYCSLSMFVASVWYGYTDDGTASFAFLALYIFGIPIAILINILLESYGKQTNTKVNSSQSKETYNFYTKISLPLLSLISISFSFLWPLNFIFLTGMIIGRWKATPTQLGKLRLLILAAILLTIPLTIQVILDDNLTFSDII
ncbi:hypothetical protein [Candidatus Poriferisocius sp.]|uniref:hypothetical protein n=1 Tax=Candidatus Poriferisocius sp. TaxID=3101276 RepID=UPI003B025DA9